MEGNDVGTNLIVNYLPQALTDEEFRQMFEEYGPLKSCKICRHKATNYSYGFGFADFQNRRDAARAVHDLNGIQLQHKRIKVAFSRPPEETAKRANLYVRNLPRHFGDGEVRDLFGQYGSIISVRVLRDAVTNISKTVAFVLFETRPDAENAIKSLNGFTPPGGSSELVVKFAEDDRKKMMAGLNYRTVPYNIQRPVQNLPLGISPVPPLTHSVFVYNIGTSCTESDVYRLFAPFGALQKVDIIKDQETDQCKGFAFVHFYDRQEAQGAIMSLNGLYYNGKPLQVRFKNRIK